MSEKVDFNGDVGQAVMGDVKEAPRLSNVVNLNLNEVKKEVQLITDYQRKRINVLVKEWAAICGDREIEIYKVFIADFGLRKFRELPIEHYLAVKATLEAWIAGAAKANAGPQPGLTSQPTAPAANQEPAHCIACDEKDAAFARSQRTNFAQWFLILILAGCCAWLLYLMPAPHESEPQAKENKCYFDGKAFSVGSSLRISGQSKKCLFVSDSTNPTWQDR